MTSTRYSKRIEIIEDFDPAPVSASNTVDSVKPLEEEKEQTPESQQAVPISITTASSSATSSDHTSSSSFHLLPHPFIAATSSLISSYYTKWCLTPTLSQMKYRYSQATPNFADSNAVQAFLCQMWNDGEVRKTFQVYSAGQRGMTTLPLQQQQQVTRVSLKPIRATLTDLHLFDKLWNKEDDENGELNIIHGDVKHDIPELKAASAEEDDDSSSDSAQGEIKKCFEDTLAGVTISNELQRLLLDRDSDNYDLFTPQERTELLFILFQHLTIGGGLNQYENKIYPYLNVLKRVYKELVSVRTNKNTGELEITSLVFKIDALYTQDTATGKEVAVPLFGGKNEKNPHHLCIATADTSKKHVNVYYFAHTDAW